MSRACARTTEPRIEFGCVTTKDIVQLIYRPDETQGNAKDYEFSKDTMEARWAAGHDDARRTLDRSPWLAPMPRDADARTFDVKASRPDAEDLRPNLPRAPATAR